MFIEKKRKGLDERVKAIEDLIDARLTYRMIPDRLRKLEELLLVDNYFYGCPCCTGDQKILKSGAKSFIKPFALCDGGNTVYLSSTCREYYTTPDSYEKHLAAITQWKKEVKNHENN